jgi:hypothetical protein
MALLASRSIGASSGAGVARRPPAQHAAPRGAGLPARSLSARSSGSRRGAANGAVPEERSRFNSREVQLEVLTSLSAMIDIDVRALQRPCSAALAASTRVGARARISTAPAPASRAAVKARTVRGLRRPLRHGEAPQRLAALLGGVADGARDAHPCRARPCPAAAPPASRRLFADNQAR